MYYTPIADNEKGSLGHVAEVPEGFQRAKRAQEEIKNRIIVKITRFVELEWLLGLDRFRNFLKDFKSYCLTEEASILSKNLTNMALI